MGLDLTTFVLEIFNFLVLLWLLSHFLYRPVQAAITKRQEQAVMADQELQAQRVRLDAQRQEVDKARAQLDDEREAARQRLKAEIAGERAKRLAQLQAEVDDERAKAQARAAALRDQQARQEGMLAERRAQDFVRHYLERLAGPQLEGAVIDLFLSDLAALDEGTRARLQEAPTGESIGVTTAFEPSAAQRERVEAALKSLLGRPAQTRWQNDAALIAGITVHIDGHLLEASLARALSAFDVGAVGAS